MPRKSKPIGQHVNYIIIKQGGVISKTFVRMLDTIYYDMELTYVKRNDVGDVL